MKIIYTETMENGEVLVRVIHPTGEISIEQVLQKDVPNWCKETAYIVDDDVIPTDRTFRDAWQHDFKVQDGKLIHTVSENVDKAKEIHKERLRTERKVLLEEQDVLFMQALEKGVDTKDVTEEKQRLKDITKLVDKCETIDDIKKINCNTGKLNADI
jgi:uncharacterized protein with ATP-grasp and redox domains